MKWAFENTWSLKHIKNYFENGKDECFPPQIFDWSMMFWLVKQSKSLNGQWLVNQLLILHPTYTSIQELLAVWQSNKFVKYAFRSKNCPSNLKYWNFKMGSSYSQKIIFHSKSGNKCTLSPAWLLRDQNHNIFSGNAKFLAKIGAPVNWNFTGAAVK